MGKYQLKTKVNDGDVKAFLNSVENEDRKEDSLILLDILSEMTGEEPKMWGKSIVGFGSYHYKYASGQEGDWMRIAFSPRKQNMTLYLMDGFSEREELLEKLGKHKIGKGCLYFKRYEELEPETLRELISASLQRMDKNYPRS